jgi:hypothetical protein
MVKKMIWSKILTIILIASINIYGIYPVPLLNEQHLKIKEENA